MKKIFSLIPILFVVGILLGQNNSFTTTFSILGQSSLVSGNTYSVSGSVTDFYGIYDGNSVAVGDSLYYLEDAVIYAGAVSSITSISGNSITFRFLSTEALLSGSAGGSMSGQIVIARKNLQGYCAVPSGTNEGLRWALENRFKKLLANDITFAKDTTGYKFVTRTQADVNYKTIASYVTDTTGNYVKYYQAAPFFGDSTNISLTTTAAGVTKGTIIPNSIDSVSVKARGITASDLSQQAIDSTFNLTEAKITTSQETNFPYRNYYAKYADVIAGTANSSLKIAHVGDSNVEVGTFEVAMKATLKVTMPQKGAGWVSLNSSKTLVSGVTRTVVGFTNQSITNDVSTGIDLSHVVSTSANDSVIINYPNSLVTKDNSTFTNAIIFASGTGTFTASIENGTPTVFTLTPSVQAFNITVAEGRYKLAINAGGANQKFYGVAFNCTSPSFTYYRLGASGRTFREFATIDQAALTTQLNAISPNLLLVQYGSNDFVDAGATAASIMTNVRLFVDKIKIASPLTDIAFIIPSDRNAISGTTLEKAFADSLTSFCIRNRYNFYDLFKTYGYQPDAQTLGYFGDEVHYTAKGHGLNAKLVSRNLLNTEDANSWKRTGSNAEFIFFDPTNLGGVQIGRATATGGYLDVYNPLTGNLLTLQGNNNSYMSLSTSGGNGMGLQVIDGNFSRLTSSLPFRIYDNIGLKMDIGATATTFYSQLATTGTIYAPTFTNGNALFGVNYVLDIATNNTKKPVRFQNLPIGSITSDSVVSSLAGELRRIGVNQLLKPTSDTLRGNAIVYVPSNTGALAFGNGAKQVLIFNNTTTITSFTFTLPSTNNIIGDEISIYVKGTGTAATGINWAGPIDGVTPNVLNKSDHVKFIWDGTTWLRVIN